MPVVECASSLNISNANWNPVGGTLVQCTDQRFSGNYLENFAGFTNFAEFICDNPSPTDPAVIPPGSTINTVTLVCHCEGLAIGHGSPLIEVGINPHGPYAPYNVTTIPPGSLSDLTVVYAPGGTPIPIDVADLQLSIFNVGSPNGPSYGLVHVDYLAWSIDFTPPPTPMVMTWMSYATAPGIIFPPPLKKFKPFELLPVTAINPTDITALWSQRYGPAPSGATLWLISRSLDTNLSPNADSFLHIFVVP